TRVQKRLGRAKCGYGRSAVALGAERRVAGASQDQHFLKPRGQHRHGALSNRSAKEATSEVLPMATLLAYPGRDGCCARAASGHTAAPPSVAKNFRRPMWLAK